MKLLLNFYNEVKVKIKIIMSLGGWESVYYERFYQDSLIRACIINTSKLMDWVSLHSILKLFNDLS